MKESVYFSHDSNAKDDPKCMLLIDQLGLEGYGAFWILIEILREQPEFKYPLKLLSICAKRYNISEAKLQAVVNSFGLFEIEGEDFFFSASLRRRMAKMIDTQEKRRIAGKASGAARRALSEHKTNICSTNDEEMLNKNEQIKIKENKIYKEKIYKKESQTIPPSLEDVSAYCRERNNSIDPAFFIDYYEAKGWMYGKNKIKDWKAAVRTFERFSNKPINHSHETATKRYQQL